MEISNDIIFRSPENGDYILLDCSTSNVTKNGLYQKLPDGRTALKIKINGLDALYVLPIASATTLGGIKVGSGLTINPTTGVLSATGGGTGTVTSVSVSGQPTPLFTVSIANPTTTPSFTFTQVAQASNLVYASPNGSSGNPTFRALVAGDIPSLNYVTSVGATAPLTSSGGYTPTLSTSMSTNKLIGRYNSGTGVMEEISLGSGLSLSGGVLTSTNQGGGSSVNYYLNGGTSQGSFSGSTYYQMGKTAVIGTGVDFSISADGYIANFITDANDPSLLNIPAGSWNISAYFSASSSGGTPSFYCELYKYDGSTLTLIASSSSTPESISSGTSIDLYVTSLAVPSTTLSITDRLAIRIYVSHSGRTITLHTQDSHLCQIATTFSSGITALNGLTAQVQTFATGTSGTDFGISSSSSTHTFNLPIASATNTGKLSNTDWSTFNGKQAALGYTPLNPANNLSDVSNVSTARSNLGLDYTLPILAETSADGAASSGTTNTYSQGVLITPNMINVDTSIEVLAGFKKTTTFGNTTIRIYVNTTNDLTGSPILVGQYTAINTTMVQVMQRFLRIKVKNGTGAGTEVQATSLLTAQNDYVGTGVAVSNLFIDWTSNKYVIAAMQMSSSSDSGRVTFLKVRR